MEMVDVFGGYKESQRRIDALQQHDIENQRNVARDKLTNALMQEQVTNAQDRRKALADIQKIYSTNEKTPAMTRLDTVDNPDFNTASFYSKDQLVVNPLDAVGNLNNSLNTPTMQKEVSTPAVNYTQKEKNDMVRQSLISKGMFKQADEFTTMQKNMAVDDSKDLDNFMKVYEHTGRNLPLTKQILSKLAPDRAMDINGIIGVENGSPVKKVYDPDDPTKVIGYSHGDRNGVDQIHYLTNPKDKLLTPEEEAQQVRIAQAKRKPDKPAGDEKPSDIRAGIKTMADAEAKILSAPDAPETAAYAEAYNAMSKTNEYVKKSVSDPAFYNKDRTTEKWVKQPKSSGGTITAPQKDKFGYTIGEVKMGHKYLGNDQWQKQ